MPRLVLATHNPGKVKEFAHLLSDTWRGEVVGAGEMGVPSPLELRGEEGGTFEGNARIKAEAESVCTGLWSLADDSGLSVTSLGGRPGVDTAHYGGWERLLEAMQGVELREACFTCVLALARPGAETLFFGGNVRGSIAPAARGDRGFGYDPVFIPAGETRTFAEMGATEKNAVSHRSQALAALREWLKTHEYGR